jgi:hypothetical protein
LYSPKTRGPRESFVEGKSIGYFRFAVKKDVSLSNGSVPTGHRGQVTGAWNDDQFFGLTGQLVSLFAELIGMGSLTRDEEHGTRKNRLNVRDRVKFMNLTLLLSVGCVMRFGELPLGVNSPLGVR